MHILFDNTVDALTLQVKNLRQEKTYVSGDLRFIIRKMGCQSNPCCNTRCICPEHIEYDCLECKDDNILVKMDEKAWSLKRGYYQGILMIGCDETSPINLVVGGRLKLSATVERTDRCPPVDNECPPQTCCLSPCDGPEKLEYDIVDSYQDYLVLRIRDCIEYEENYCPDC